MVIITRNEEKAIQQCLSSVVRETRNMSREILLVDSSSSDHTVELARSYPVSIVQLVDPKTFSPAAGRFVGTARTNGDIVLFLDGDMVLIEGWLTHAVGLFDDAKLGGVAGRLYNVYPGEELALLHPDTLPLGRLAGLGGAGLYRRAGLRDGGSFNPFLHGEEERELGFRITRQGFYLLRESIPMVFHFTKPRVRSEIDERAQYFIGVGQIVRSYGISPLTRDVVLAQSSELRRQGLLLLVGIAIAIAWIEGWILGLVVAGSTAILSLAIIVMVKGIRRPYLLFRSVILQMSSLVKGIIRGIPSASTFSGTVKVVHLVESAR